MDIAGIALEFIAAHGLLAIFILLVLDGALLLPVFPGELVLLLAVATYADDPAALVFLILFASVAGLVGSLILYGVTRGGGRPLIERFPRFFMMPTRRRERLERIFRRPVGQTLVLFLRLVPLTRVLVSIPAGLAKMPVVRFTVLSSIGLLVYHAGFLWFAYEARKPDSAIGSNALMLREAYGNPAWGYVQANVIVTASIVLVLGIVVSILASRKMFNDPEETAGFLVGTLTTAVLFWGGLVLAVFAYMDPQWVYGLIQLGGLDIRALAAALGYGALQILITVAGLSIVVGFALGQYRLAGQRHRRRHMVMKRYAHLGQDPPEVDRGEAHDSSKP